VFVGTALAGVAGTAAEGSRFHVGAVSTAAPIIAKAKTSP